MIHFKKSLVEKLKKAPSSVPSLINLMRLTNYLLDVLLKLKSFLGK